MPVQVIHFTQTGRFYARAEGFLLQHEAEHNLILGLCAALMKSNEYKEPPLLLIAEEDGEPVGAVLQTPPFHPTVSMVKSPEVAEALAVAVHAHQPVISGISGPVPSVEQFAMAWANLVGTSSRLDMRQRIYRLDGVQPVASVAGLLRRATPDDREVLRDWFAAFERDADLPPSADLDDKIKQLFVSSTRAMYLWVDDHGTPISMAGTSGPTPHSIRIIAVYTPPEQRRKGYASATVAALSQLMLDSGYHFCTLYTDLDNPTSNHIYQEIGYQPVCDANVYRFET